MEIPRTFHNVGDRAKNVIPGNERKVKTFTHTNDTSVWVVTIQGVNTS